MQELQIYLTHSNQHYRYISCIDERAKHFNKLLYQFNMRQHQLLLFIFCRCMMNDNIIFE